MGLLNFSVPGELGVNTGEKVSARVPGDGELKSLEDGLGGYVMLRLGKLAS